jgi:hypothetical protein
LGYEELHQKSDYTRNETVVPLRTEQHIVTIVTVVPAGEGYQLTELAGQSLTQNLNLMMTAT